MMDEKRMKHLMDATGGIREEYIEEAAVSRVKRNWLVRIASAAAVLALVIGMTVAMWPEENTGPIPFFAIRAYAADGSVKVLNEVGDTIELKTGTSELFPDKMVYTIDISLEYYDGDFAKLDLDRLWVHHSRYVWAPTVKPGEPDHNLSMQWLSREEDGMYGVRLIGWCEEPEYLSFTIWDRNGTVICEKKMVITWSDGYLKDGYEADVRRSFSYREDMTTDELIDETLRQDYTLEGMVSSSAYCELIKGNCGFPELMNRPDAASKLLERYERYVNGEPLYPIAGPEYENFPGGRFDNGNLISAILHWPEFQNQMTSEEKVRFQALEKREMEMIRNKHDQK